ncbi:MAG: hypothetical protein RIS75_307 [Actinomycetota bacterium]
MSPKAFKAAVLGSPIEHSLSPTLHSTAYKAIGFAGEYGRFELVEDQLSNFLNGQGAEYSGFSLTMPLKHEAFLQASHHDSSSIMTKACNTLIASPSGWQGYNTDVIGFINAFKRVGIKHVDDVLVIGAGATARSAIAAVSEMGATYIRVMARRESAVEEIKEQFPDVEISAIAWQTTLPECTYVINTAPAAATSDMKFARKTSALFDVIYAPWPTKLALTAEENDVLVLGGLELLVAQAVEQVILMTRCDESLRDNIYSVMYEAGFKEQALRSARN